MLPSVLIIVIEALILVLGLFIVVYHHYYNIIIAKVYVKPVYEVNPIELKGPR